MTFEAERLQGLSAYRKTYAEPGAVRMDQNENNVGNAKELTITQEEIRKYPDEQPFGKLLAEQWKLPLDSIMLFNGASEAIQCTCLAFLNTGSRVTIPTPAFALTSHYLTLAGGVLSEIPLNSEMEFDLDAITISLEKGADLFITSSPHNPSGAVLPKETVTGWCRKFPRILFVVDEAYASFGKETLLGETTVHSNLLVIRSFSKDWGLAGLRLGAAAGPPPLINALGKVRTPFSINSAALSAGLRLLKSEKRLRNSISKQIVFRDILAEETKKIGLPVKAGSGNFFLITGERAEEFYRFCLLSGVVIRLLGKSIARVSPSDKSGNEKYLKCLRKWKELKA